MKMQIVERLSPEHVEMFRSFEKQWRKQLERGMFYAEGTLVIEALLRSNFTIRALLITPELFQKYRSVIEQRTLDLLIAEKSSIESIVQRRLNQGVIAVSEVPVAPPLESLLSQPVCCVVALNGIDHAVNVGSILRNCAAFNVTAVVFDEKTIHPYCWRSIKASIGGVFHLPVYETNDLATSLQQMKETGITLMAADPTGAVELSESTSVGRVCLILGNEHHGVSANILDLEPIRVSIRMKNVDSLNVAAASAVFLHRISVLARNDNHG